MQADPIEADNVQSTETPVNLLTERRWGILPVLAWIVTHDVHILAQAAVCGMTKSLLGARLAMAKALAKVNDERIDWPCKGLEDAWQLLATAMDSGQIRCTAEWTSQSRLGGMSKTVPGMAFPPPDTHEIADVCILEDDNGTPIIVPKGWLTAATWSGFRNPMFDRDAVLKLWPVETPSEVSSDPGVVVSRPKQISNSVLREAFEEYRVAPGANLSRDAIEAWGRKRWGDGVAVTRLRALYKEIAPMGGHKRGRKAAVA